MSREENGTLDLMVILDDMWKGLKRFFWLGLVIVSLSASFFYFRARKNYVPVYDAYTSFVVNSNQAYGYSTTFYNKTTAAQMSRTFPYIVTSGVLRKVVAEELGVVYVSSGISAEAMAETNLFTIHVTDTDPQMAYDVLLSVIKNYPKVAEYIIGGTQLIMMDESGVPKFPQNAPVFKPAAFKGAIYGGVLFIGLLFLYAFTRKTVRREEDMKRLTNIPCIGSIPNIHFKKHSSREAQQLLIDNKKVPFGFVEAVRTIRTRIEKESKEKGHKVFLVTSAIPGEGKTTVAANVAIALGKKGKNVLLVDGDLRNPSVLETLGEEPAAYGLKEVIDQTISFSDALRVLKEKNIWIFAGSVGEQNSTPVVAADFLWKILEAAKKQMDYVIIDTPPSSVLSDAAILARHVHGAIFVVRQDYAKTDRILKGMEMISDTGTDMVGYIINGAQSGITGYGYGRGYGYGYGYGYGSRYSYGSSYGYGKGYGYGQDKKKEEKKEE